MKITQANKYHICWWLGKNLRIVRIDLNYTEGRDWKQWIGFHFIQGGGIRLIKKDGIMWEITT